jgi:hypothetical protein
MLTPRIERFVRESFDESEADLVLSVLAEWRISYVPEPPSERLIAAVVFMADGRLEGVDEALRLAEQDWRDLLVAGDLANGDWPEQLGARLGPEPRRSR